MEIIGHLHQDVPASPAVLSIQVDDGVSGGAASGEEVENKGLPLLTTAHSEYPLEQPGRFGGLEDVLCFSLHAFQFLLTLLIVPYFLVCP